MMNSILWKRTPRMEIGSVVCQKTPPTETPIIAFLRKFAIKTLRSRIHKMIDLLRFSHADLGKELAYLR